MKFSDLVSTLNTTSKELRAIIKTLKLDIAPQARVIPDDAVKIITKAWKEQAKEGKAEKKEASAKKTVKKEAKPKTEAKTKKEPAKKKEEKSEEKSTKKKVTQKKEVKKEEEHKQEKKKEPEAKKEAKPVQKKPVPKPIEEEEELFEEEELALEEEIPEDLAEEEELKLVKQMQREMRAAEKKQKHKKAQEEGEETPSTIVPLVKNIEIPEVITVKEFAEKIGIPVSKAIAELLKNGIAVTLNHQIDYDTASLIAGEFGITTQKIIKDFSSEDLMSGNVEKLLSNEDPDLQTERPPIISIMGHVDHGKTSLLDYIRKTKVVSQESGGITQHLGAYQVIHGEKAITFLDTPGHEAFTKMRARGAKATDIAILVVAADEGVKPQTIEAINHAKEANIPIIVALNKIDKEGVNMERVRNSLSEHGLIPEEWGGETPMVPVSAKTGQGIPELLEIILLVAEMANLRANPDRSAIGTVIESHLDQSLGPVATILINTGTLNIMDNVVVGEVYGRIKVMYDQHGKRIKEAIPSTPVLIAGLSALPHAGDLLQAETDEKSAREKAMSIQALRKSKQFVDGVGLDLSQLISRINEGKMKQLKIVLKADAKGSLEAIIGALANINTEEVKVQVIHSGIGNITDTDVLMASASQGLVIAFHVQSSPQVAKLADKMHVTVKHYRVIYQILDDLKALLSGMLDPEIREVSLGDLKILAIFYSGKREMIVGGRVIKGKIENKAKVRVIRQDKLIGEGEITNMKKGTEAVSDVAEGHECGVRFSGNCTIEEGDILEFYRMEKITRSL